MSKQEKTPLSGRGSDCCVGIQDGSNNESDNATIHHLDANQQTIVKPVLFTATQASNYLNIKKGTLANWRSQFPDKLAFIRVGRCIRYAKSDLDQFIASNRCTDGGEA